MLILPSDFPNQSVWYTEYCSSDSVYNTIWRNTALTWLNLKWLKVRIYNTATSNECVWASLGVCGRIHKSISEPPHASYAQTVGTERL